MKTFHTCPVHARRLLRPPTAMALAAAAVALSACGTNGSPGADAGLGPAVRFVCNDAPPSTIVARYRQPDASSMTLRRADSVAELQRQPAASGARYEGANVQFWEHQGEVQLRWGPNAMPLRCVRQG